jgi:hypothetical protein
MKTRKIAGHKVELINEDCLIFGPYVIGLPLVLEKINKGDKKIIMHDGVEIPVSQFRYWVKK